MSFVSRWCTSCAWLAALCAIGCGLVPVELGPSAAPPLDSDDIVIGDVAVSAIARLRADQSAGARGSIAFVYPGSAALTLPANLAPITFEWADHNSGRPMPDPADAMMSAPAPAMAKAPAATPTPMATPPAMPLGPAANDAVIAYELLVHGQRGDVHLFTSGSSAALPSDRWRELLRENTEAVLGVELRALRASGAVESADPLELTIWTAPPAGVLYSWSTTARGLALAGLELTHEQHLTPPSPIATDGSGTCVGCHAVSRDGKQLLAAMGGSPGLASWSVLNGTPLELPFDDAQPKPYVFGSFDPTAARIAVTEAGRLLILNADTGQVLQKSAWPLSVASDYPTWSPDGRSIALVLMSPSPAKAAAVGGVLARIAVALDGSLGDPESLVTAMGDEALLAPSYSPDGDWIAFEKRKGKAQNPRDGTLWLVRASGGVPIELAAATDDRMPPLGASSPAFIPGDVPGRAFIMFAAQRPVGSFVPADGQRQLFAAALNLQLAAAGADPSSPAFWLPFQQRTSSYLRAQWAPALTQCTPTQEVCDGNDDDCDGRSDEDCCDPKPESCGDGNDDDCDGLSDEGCGCAFREVCDNQRDDDCDERIDEQPCAPAPMQK